jgi:hypothetical protein
VAPKLPLWPNLGVGTKEGFETSFRKENFLMVYFSMTGDLKTSVGIIGPLNRRMLSSVIHGV